MAYTRRRLTKPKKPKTKSNAKPRRKLQAIPLAAAAFATKYAYNRYRANQANTALLNRKRARYSRNQRLEMSDNITTASTVVIGKQRKPSFAEAVAMTIRKPLTFKRNWAFNVESTSGRKAWFCMNVNEMTTNDLQIDITTYKSAMTTDTGVGDAQIAVNNLGDDGQFYIDYHKEKIQMVNSSSNSLTGKIHLYCHKRDTDAVYDSARIDPIAMMMYYSNNAKSLLTTGVGNETTIGNGWSFNTSTAGSNYSAQYNMPGAPVYNPYGVAAVTDPLLSPNSAHIKDRVGFWFKKVGESIPFSLKPGQQFNSNFVFNLENNKIHRELQEFIHMANISYNIVVEFQAGIVGSSDATTGEGQVSIGTAQLSIIRENSRRLGLSNKTKEKIVLQTAPLATIANGFQTIINQDSGISDVGVDIDV
jgi:hypothetical protein